MAYPRKRFTKRRPTYKRKRMTKRMPLAKRPNINVHSFKRMLAGDFTNWSTGTVRDGCSRIAGNAVNLPWLGGFQLNGLSSVLNTGEFTALFDQYRIDKLVLKFYLKIDPGAQAAGAANVPRLYYYRDRDDSTPATSLNEIRENGRGRLVPLSLYRPVTIVCRPNTLGLIYQSSVSSTYSPKFGQWIDCSNPGTPHYTWKMAIDDLTNTNYRVDVEGEVFFTCRQSR